jgi:L-ascorbate metabolism protein UlaG (beta-lactamase superfamily)
MRFLTAVARWVERLLAGLFALLALAALIVTMLWRDRIHLDELPVAAAPESRERPGEVSVTWFGVTTLLFDDGETQVLVDGFISRPGLIDLLADRPVDNDAAKINWFLNEFDVRRLAAVVPLHSHFDHAMDIGAIANRTNASIVGSASAANIARGAGVPPDQIIEVSDGDEFDFGEFTIIFVRSGHAPIGWRGEVPLAGRIDAPLSLPAPVSAMRAGASYSVVVSHPAGSALVQGTAGVREGKLDHLSVDTVLLGVDMIEGLGRDYINRYWRSTVTSTGARMVVPIHFDDYTRPFGEIEPAPKLLDDFSVSLRIMEELRDTWDRDTELYLPAFGVPMPVRPPPRPAATLPSVSESFER